MVRKTYRGFEHPRVGTPANPDNLYEALPEDAAKAFRDMMKGLQKNIAEFEASYKSASATEIRAVVLEALNQHQLHQNDPDRQVPPFQNQFDLSQNHWSRRTEKTPGSREP